MAQEQDDNQTTDAMENVEEKNKEAVSESADVSDVQDSAGDGAKASGRVAPVGSSGLVPDLPDFTSMLDEAASNSIELLEDVELDVKIELGRAEMEIGEILRLHGGSVIELDKLAGDPVDVLVNEQLVARGEVLVVNDNFCVRINEIIPGITEKYGRMASHS
jgi:flagellar motor switch protein FliN/FliY